MPLVKIDLSDPIPSHRGESVREFEFREPIFEDWQDLGDPETKFVSDAGQWDQINSELVSAWAQRLLMPPGDPLVLRKASLRDTMKIKKAILDFFRLAARGMTMADLSLIEPPNNSPSGTDSNGSSSEK